MKRPGALPQIAVTFYGTVFQVSLLSALFDLAQFESAPRGSGMELSAPTLDAYEGLLDLVTGVLAEALREAAPYRGEAFAARLRSFVTECVLPRLEDHLSQPSSPQKK